MNRTELIHLCAIAYMIKEPVKGRDPALCVKDATYWVDRLLKLTTPAVEGEKKEEAKVLAPEPAPVAKKMDARTPVLRRPKH